MDAANVSSSWEERMHDLLLLAHRSELVRRQLKRTNNVTEIIAVAENHGVQLEASDLVMTYRYLNDNFWPWHGRPMQHRRHFIHQGGLPAD